MKKLYDILNKKKLTPDEYYVLWSIEHSQECSLTNVEELKIKLINNKMLINDKVIPSISTIINRLDLMLSDDPAKRMSLTTNYSEKVVEYQDMWPKGKVGVHNRRLWNSSKNLEAAFKWFFNNYNFDWEIVLQATKLYLNQEEDISYPFTRTSKYFIRKADPGMSSQSDLADYCELILNGGIDEEEEVKHFV